MQDFSWICPTQFHFGKGANDKVGAEVARLGGTRVLLAYGGGSAVRSGLLDLVKSSLEAAGVAYVEFGGIRPNPEINEVRRGVALVRENELDFIVAVGGGSVIDCAKAIAFSVDYDGDPWDFFDRKVAIGACLPIACVLTIPAAGSESSASCVISNDELKLKRGVGSDNFIPALAFMNPELTCTLPPYQTAAGASDMIAHICERWFSGAGAVPVTDATAAGLLRTIMDATEACLADPNDYDARANLMWAGSLAHNGIAGVGRNLSPTTRAGGWESHALEHELSAHRIEVTHGAGLAVVMPAWMRHVWKADPERFLDFAEQVFGIELEVDADDGGDAAAGAAQCDGGAAGPIEGEPEVAIAIQEVVLMGISALEDFFKRIGMPTRLSEFGFTAEDIPALLDTLEQNRGAEFGAFCTINRADAEAIYRSVL